MSSNSDGTEKKTFSMFDTKPIAVGIEIAVPCQLEKNQKQSMNLMKTTFNEANKNET